MKWFGRVVGSVLVVDAKNHGQTLLETRLIDSVFGFD